MSDWHLAQVNVAKMRWPLEDERMHGFTSRLDEINALAEQSNGFVWRFIDDSGAATNTRPFDDPQILFNLSVWENFDALKVFVYQSTHRELLGTRKDWFYADDTANMALWWVPKGNIPTVEESLYRLARIRELGSTAEAFNLARPWGPTDLE